MFALKKKYNSLYHLSIFITIYYNTKVNLVWLITRVEIRMYVIVASDRVFVCVFVPTENEIRYGGA